MTTNDPHTSAADPGKSDAAATDPATTDSLPLPGRAHPWYAGLAAGTRARDALPEDCRDPGSP